MPERRYNKPEVVVVDDDPLDLATICQALADEYIVHPFLNPKAAEFVLESRPIEIAILDLRLPGDGGINTLLLWRRKYPKVETLFCSGETRLERALECIRRGAADFIPKPFKTEHISAILRSMRDKRDAKLELEAAQRGEDPVNPLCIPSSYTEFIGATKSVDRVRTQVKSLKRHDEVSILIVGESGTGKEVIAQMLHHQENSKRRPFVTVNMAALPATLVESELFGVEKGAYTDAKHSRAGKFEMANRGDLFWMRSVTLPSTLKPNFCVCSKTGSFNEWAPIR